MSLFGGGFGGGASLFGGGFGGASLFGGGNVLCVLLFMLDLNVLNLEVWCVFLFDIGGVFDDLLFVVYVWLGARFRVVI